MGGRKQAEGGSTHAGEAPTRAPRSARGIAAGVLARFSKLPWGGGTEAALATTHGRNLSGGEKPLTPERHAEVKSALFYFANLEPDSPEGKAAAKFLGKVRAIAQKSEDAELRIRALTVLKFFRDQKAAPIAQAIRDDNGENNTYLVSAAKELLQTLSEDVPKQ